MTLLMVSCKKSGIIKRMTRLVRNTIAYLDGVLGERVTLRSWSRSERLPQFLRDRYAFFEGRLFETPLLFMAARASEEETPAVVRKHIARLREEWEHPVVYVREHVTSYNRKRLVEQRVPFVIPGRQMYLLPLGLDFRERFSVARPRVMMLSPSAQALLIDVLLYSGEESLTAARFDSRLGYAPITFSRAFDELESVGLAESHSVGRTRRLRLIAPKKVVWEQSQTLLRSPIRRLYHVRDKPHALRGLAAGLSALSCRSMLVEPDHPVIAVSRDDWRLACRHGSIEPVPMRESETVDVEVWMYPPEHLGEAGIVDPLSLFLSLREEADERVEAALDRMLETLPW